MANKLRPYDTAPKDGTVVLLSADDAGESPMRWNPEGFNPLVSSRPGIWELVGSGMTWSDEDPDDDLRPAVYSRSMGRGQIRLGR